MISDRVFPNGNRFFIQENYRRSRMGKGIIVLDWEIGIFNKLFYVYIAFFQQFFTKKKKKNRFPDFIMQ